MKKPDIVERVGSNIITQLAGTVLGAIHPAGSILPSLLGSEASRRMQNRIGDAIEDLELKVSELKIDVAKMNDAQFKFVSDTVSTLIQTNDEKKIEYLKKAILNGIKKSDLSQETSYIASRVLRDISAIEMVFLLDAMSRSRIIPTKADQDGAIPITDIESKTVRDSPENLTIINGLSSLGLIVKEHKAGMSYAVTPIAEILTKFIE